MATLTYKASTLTRKKKPRTQKYQQGTEYVDFDKDGINTNLPEYSVTFKDNVPTIELIDGFLTEMNGTQSFLFNPLNGVLGKSAVVVLCEEWDVSYDSTGYATLSATFIEQPDFITS